MRLCVFSTHPIQYQVPLWRALARDPDIELHVYYFSDQGVSGTVDADFGAAVTWDVPLLDGYASTFLTRRPIESSNDFSIPDPVRLLADARPDVVLLHGYMHRFARQVLAHKRRFGYRVVLRAEFTEMRRSSRTLLRGLARNVYLRWFYPQVDQFCFIGRDAHKHLEAFGVPGERRHFAPYSVDDALIERMRQTWTRASARAQLGLPMEARVVLFSGKMIPRKQPLLLADALLALAEDLPGLTPVFLGSGEQYEALVARLRPTFGPRLLAPGFVNQGQLGPYFVGSDVFVLPSDYDTWGLVVNEAMHYGLPCVVSDRVGSSRDLIEEGVTGFTFPYQSANALAERLRQCLGNPAGLQDMGEAARSRVSRYRIDDTVAGIREAVHSAARQRTA